MNRRFVNLVTRNLLDGVYSLRRLNPYAHLFYQSIDEAEEAADVASDYDSNYYYKKKKNFARPKMQRLHRLPEAIARFDPSPTGLSHDCGLEWFSLLGPRTSESKIVNANTAGDTMLYDADKRLILNLPSLNVPKGSSPVCLSITHPGADEDSLYVLDLYPGRAVTRRSTREHLPRSCFEVLAYSSHPDDAEAVKGWSWRLLPPPPFVNQPGYKPTMITSYTVVNGGSSICISSDRNGLGTYCFDTNNCEEWRRVGEWALPFDGSAEYIPEFDLWLGFLSCRPNHLCAVDLSSMDHGRPPTAQHIWEDLNPPGDEDWQSTHVRILNLGSGRFCVAKFFGDEPSGRQFAVLTGVEIVRGGGDDGGRSRLQMFKHKRIFYLFSVDVIHRLL